MHMYGIGVCKAPGAGNIPSRLFSLEHEHPVRGLPITLSAFMIPDNNYPHMLTLHLVLNRKEVRSTAVEVEILSPTLDPRYVSNPSLQEDALEQA